MRTSPNSVRVRTGGVSADATLRGVCRDRGAAVVGVGQRTRGGLIRTPAKRVPQCRSPLTSRQFAD
jgi:hypothetical protein